MTDEALRRILRRMIRLGFEARADDDGEPKFVPMGEAEKREFAREHVPAAPVAGRVGEPVTGAALAELYEAARSSGARFREDLDLLYAHTKDRSFDPGQVAPILDGIRRKVKGGSDA